MYVPSGFTFRILPSSHTVYLSFIWLSELMAIIFLYSINWLVFVTEIQCVISSFRHDVNEICALLGCYTAYHAKYLPTFRDDPSVPSSAFWLYWPLQIGSIGCPQTSLRIYHWTLRNNPEECIYRDTVCLLRGTHWIFCCSSVYS